MSKWKSIPCIGTEWLDLLLSTCCWVVRGRAPYLLVIIKQKISSSLAPMYCMMPSELFRWQPSRSWIDRFCRIKFFLLFPTSFSLGTSYEPFIPSSSSSWHLSKERNSSACGDGVDLSRRLQVKSSNRNERKRRLGTWESKKMGCSLSEKCFEFFPPRFVHLFDIYQWPLVRIYSVWFVFS